MADSEARFGSTRPCIGVDALTAGGPVVGERSRSAARVEPSVLVAFGVDEGLQRQPELRREFVLTKRPEERDGLLVGMELRHTVRAALQVRFQLLLKGGWQLPFQIVRQKPDNGTAAAPAHEFF